MGRSSISTGEMTLAQPTAIINAVFFFFVWITILWAGADHPPPVGFWALIPLIFLAAALVFWRVPAYLQWLETGRGGRLLRVAGEGVAAGVACAALGILVSLLVGTGELGALKLLSSASSIALWFAVLAVVGAGNALAVYLVNSLVWRILEGPGA